jgi:hypothetical protein
MQTRREAGAQSHGASGVSRGAAIGEPDFDKGGPTLDILRAELVNRLRAEYLQ